MLKNAVSFPVLYSFPNSPDRCITSNCIYTVDYFRFVLLHYCSILITFVVITEKMQYTMDKQYYQFAEHIVSQFSRLFHGFRIRNNNFA
jgi:hypothetical protein